MTSNGRRSGPLALTDHGSSVGDEARPEPSDFTTPFSTVSPNSIENQ